VTHSKGSKLAYFIINRAAGSISARQQSGQVSVQVSGRRHRTLRTVLEGVRACHSREGGNPDGFDGFLDPRLRGGDIVGMLAHNPKSPGYFHRHAGNRPFDSDVDNSRDGPLFYGYRDEEPEIIVV
jgi:hypothetical protein